MPLAPSPINVRPADDLIPTELVDQCQWLPHPTLRYPALSPVSLAAYSAPKHAFFERCGSSRPQD